MRINIRAGKSRRRPDLLPPLIAMLDLPDGHPAVLVAEAEEGDSNMSLLLSRAWSARPVVHGVHTCRTPFTGSPAAFADA